MYRYNKTSIILKISIAVLFIIGMVLECSCERSEEPEKRGTGYITCTLRWDSVVAGSPVPEKLRYCIYPSEGGPMIQTDGNANGITLFLPPDKYNVLVFNLKWFLGCRFNIMANIPPPILQKGCQWTLRQCLTLFIS